MIPFDYHPHSDFSCDCRTSMGEMVQSAPDRGIPEIGFLGHPDLLTLDPGFATFRIGTWWQGLQRCRQAFAPALSIRAGVELSELHRVRHAAGAAWQGLPRHDVAGGLPWAGQRLVFDRSLFDRRPYAIPLPHAGPED